MSPNRRTLLVAPLVGLVAGFGAVAFRCLTTVIEQVALVDGAGWDQGRPANEVNIAALFGWTGPDGGLNVWVLLGVLILGGLVTGVLVYTLAPEAEGHGTDAAIRAFHQRAGRVRPRVALVKLVASAVTLGTGGSGGKEGPIAQIGATFGSFIATRLRLTDFERRMLLAAGVGAGIGAIFHAPLAGGIFAMEVMYRDLEFESEALAPSFIAVTVSYCTLGVFFGFQPLFAVMPMSFTSPWLLPPLLLLAGVCAAAARVYVWTFYTTRDVFRSMPVPRIIKPAIGAGLAGLVAIGGYSLMGGSSEPMQRAALGTLGFGYGFLQSIYGGGPGDHLALTQNAGAALLLLCIVGVGKILTTSLTIGSGGSAGVFGASMVMGGAIGAAFGVLGHIVAPGLIRPEHVPMFGICGMAGFFSAAAKTPVSTLIMVGELTGSHGLTVASMLVCAVSYLLVRKAPSIYSEQMPARRDSPAHYGDFHQDTLDRLTIRDARDAVRRTFVAFRDTDTLDDIQPRLFAPRQECFPVLDADGRYVGLLGLDDVRQFLYNHRDRTDTPVRDIMRTGEMAVPLTAESDVSQLMKRFADEPFDQLPIIDIDDPERIIGLLDRHDILALYNRDEIARRDQAHG